MRGIALAILTAGLIISSSLDKTALDTETAKFAGQCLWAAVMITLVVIAIGV